MPKRLPPDYLALEREAWQDNTLDQIKSIAGGMKGKRLTYKELTHGKH